MQLLANLLQIGLLIISFFCVTWEAYTCLNQYTSMPTGTRIYFADLDTVEKPSISFCLAKELYNIKKIVKCRKCDWTYVHYTEFMETYNKSHADFWGKETQLADMISHVNISSGSNNWESVWNDRISEELTTKLFTNLFVPLIANRFQFCYSLNLAQLKGFTMMRFGFKADIHFVLHMPGQLSSSAAGRLSAMIPSSLNNEILVHQDTVYNVEFKYNLLDLEASQTHQTYDQCVESAALNASMNKANCSLPINPSGKDFERYRCSNQLPPTERVFIKAVHQLLGSVIIAFTI